MVLNALEKRVIELSYKFKLSHISSCLNVVNLLDQIYNERKDDDPVILCNSHGALGLWVVLESRGLCDAEEMVKTYGTHASRDMKNGVWCSGGSLGQPTTIAAGFALADRKRDVYLVTSDGACSEGSVWEAFNLVTDLHLTNLKIYVVANGWGAYRPISLISLYAKMSAFLPHNYLYFHTPVMPFEWLKGLAGHYLTLSEAQYKEAMA